MCSWLCDTRWVRQNLPSSQHTHTNLYVRIEKEMLDLWFFWYILLLNSIAGKLKMVKTESKSLTIEKDWSQAGGPLGYREVSICSKPKKPQDFFLQQAQRRRISFGQGPVDQSYNVLHSFVFPESCRKLDL